MNEKTVNINNFIGIYDNYITSQECDKAIKLYENQNKFNNTFSRISFEKASILNKQDQQFFAGPSNINIWWEELKPMIVNFDLAWSHYAKNVGAIDAYGGEPFHYASGGAFPYDFQIEQSARFTRAESSYLSRTIQSGGSTRAWTLSFWIKLWAKD